MTDHMRPVIGGMCNTEMKGEPLNSSGFGRECCQSGKHWRDRDEVFSDNRYQISDENINVFARRLDETPGNLRH